MANGIIPIAEGQGTRHAKRANRFVQEDDTFVIKGHVEGNGSPMSVGTVATSFTSSSGSKSITALGQTSPQRWADFAADTYSTRAQHREALISAVAECEKELDELFYEQYGYCHTFLISLAQVVSSGDIPMVWKYIFGKACPQGYVGMSGVISSSLVILREIQLNLPPWDPKTKVD
jgi:hypothetical protein